MIRIKTKTNQRTKRMIHTTSAARNPLRAALALFGFSEDHTIHKISPTIGMIKLKRLMPQPP